MHSNKLITQSAVAWIATVWSLAAVALAGQTSDQSMVVAVSSESVATNGAPFVDAQASALARQRMVALTGSAGLYTCPAFAGGWNFESIGMRQARAEAVVPVGGVEIGPLEFLSSGPTGTMTPEAMAAATTEVTQQVQVRIKATDRIMALLAERAQSRDDVTQIRFKVLAKEVADLRQALTDDLKAVQQASDDQWSNARGKLASTFFAYVQAMHRAENTVSGGTAAP